MWYVPLFSTVFVETDLDGDVRISVPIQRIADFWCASLKVIDAKELVMRDFVNA